MCKDPLHNFLHALPKCEHHMHLEGALTPQLLFKFAAKNSIDLPKDDPAFASIDALTARYNRFTSLDDFLQYYYIGMSVLIEASDFEDLAWDYFTRSAKDGLVHAEVFFDPQAHISRGIAVEVILKGFQTARARAKAELDISSELICCFLRHLPPKDCLTTFNLPPLQQRFRQGDIVGIGLDSSEKPFPPAPFTDLYNQAASQGLRLTAHAGEEGPASYIRSALESLHIERIDHGIRLAEDAELLAKVAANRNMMLTVCPISNVLLQCAPSVADLPIRTFLDAGVNFSLNSDDPAYFGGHYILDNYCAVQEAFHLSQAEWLRIARAAVRGSWCGDGRKREILARLDEVMVRWSHDDGAD